MVLDPLDLVVLASFTVVFAEVYRRILYRRMLVKAARVVQALKQGEDVPEAAIIRRMASWALPVLVATVLEKGDDGKWHLTDTGKGIAGAVLQAAAELIRKRVPKDAATGLGLGDLDIGQVIAAALPKEYRAFGGPIARIAERFLGPLLEGLGGSGGGTSSAGKKKSDETAGPITR